MESTTKPKIDREAIDLLATKHLGKAPQRVIELKDGWYNAAFRLDLDGGESFVLKIAPLPGTPILGYEKEMMRAEVEVARRLMTETDLPLPEIVAVDFSRELWPSDYFLMRLLPGRPLDHVRPKLSPEAQARIDRTLGVYLKTLHGLKGENFGFYNGPHFPTWRQAFEYRMESLKADAQEVGLSAELSHGFAFGASLYLSLDHVQEPCLCHWDLWDGNVFVDEGKIVGLIDFERAYFGDPALEVNFMGPSDAFLEGYGSDPRTSPGGLDRRKFYDLYLYLVMIIESRFRGYTAEHEAWPWARLAEIVP